MPGSADGPPINSRRIVLAVAFTVQTGPLSVLDADTDRVMAAALTDYLNADEVNGLPMFIVPASFVVVAADEHGAYPVPVGPSEARTRSVRSGPDGRPDVATAPAPRDS